MRLKCVLILVLGIASCQYSCSQTQKNETSVQQEPDFSIPEKQISVFFNVYKTNSALALKDLFITNPSFTSASQLSPLQNAVDSAKMLYGVYTGHDFITKKFTSSSFVLFSYLVKHQKQPVRFTFIFYKPREKWQFFKLKIDEDVTAELEDSAKVYFIK